MAANAREERPTMSKNFDKVDRAFLRDDPQEAMSMLDDPMDFIYGICSAIDKATTGGKSVTLGPIQARLASAAMFKVAEDNRRKAKAA
jgi:hypothetical protein